VSVGRPRRFCLVTTFYPPASFGGDGIFVRQLARELARRGHEVDVVHHAGAYRTLGGRSREPDPGDDPPNLRVHALDAGAGALEPLLMHQLGRPVLLARRLRALLARPYDVIHYHNVSLVGGPRVLAYGSGVKLYTAHEAWLVCPTHTLFRYNREPCERPTCFRCALVYRRPPQLWRASRRFRSALAHIDAFIAPSAASARAHRARGLDLPFVELPNFLSDGDGASAAASSARDPSAPPYLLFVGRLERLKGVHTLLPAMAELPGLELRIAGRGSEEARLRAAAGPGVRFLGHRPQSELRQLYRDALAVVVPSLCHEVFPLVALEALREGTPIVVPDRGALPDIASESGGGLVYRDAPELVAALARLRDEAGLRDRLGERGRRAFRERWTAEAHLARYFALVDRLAAGKRIGA
jgi:glycosyltransferase involved in cell wall biosynthesis